MLAAALSLLAACGGSAASGDTVLAGIGRIPGAAGPGGSLSLDGANLTVPGVQGDAIGARATGNRLIVIGDSILAGTAARYGNEMCNALKPLGWRTVVEAESGQSASFGREVLRERIYEGWDAAVVFLGTNPSASIERYRQDMERIVVSLAPRPTLLLTTTLFRDSQKAVNDVIRELASSNDHVSVLDWGTASAQRGVLNNDGVHPTVLGRALLVRSITGALGQAPEGTPGCIDALFTDDTRMSGVTTTVAVPVTGPTVTAPVTTLPAQPAPSPATTVPAAAGVTTTTRPL
jgi:lysophospholipase L1-like esterase